MILELTPLYCLEWFQKNYLNILIFQLSFQICFFHQSWYTIYIFLRKEKSIIKIAKKMIYIISAKVLLCNWIPYIWSVLHECKRHKHQHWWLKKANEVTVTLMGCLSQMSYKLVCENNFFHSTFSPFKENALFSGKFR